MNRLAPLITRSQAEPASIRAQTAPVLLSASDWSFAPLLRPAPGWADDLKLFATVWLGGLVFFGTLLA